VQNRHSATSRVGNSVQVPSTEVCPSIERKRRKKKRNNEREEQGGKERDSQRLIMTRRY
jgi:hypothetical protein